MDADGERRLTADALDPDDPRRIAAQFTAAAPRPVWAGLGSEDAGGGAGLHPHPVPAFISFVFARLLEARAPDAPA